MDKLARAAFNNAFDEKLFSTLQNDLAARVGPVPFRVAETPFFLSHALRDRLSRASVEIVDQLLRPDALAEMKKAIPAHYNAPGMSALPDCVQVDFAICKGEAADGFDIRVVELQAFPSLFAFESELALAWIKTLESQPGLSGDWSCFFSDTQANTYEYVKRALLGGCAPEEVVLVDYQPEHQKTVCDFVATQRLFGIESVDIEKIQKRGKSLFRERNGEWIQIRRIFNRMVFDELEQKKVHVPFDWREELDITWCSHPNWYWTWSKASLPFLDHETVPTSRRLSDIDFSKLGDLTRYVVKPLFSFAGTGVIVDVTREALDAIPKDVHHQWILQDKIEYASAIEAPDGNGVKAEVRMMLIRDHNGTELRPMLPLVRLSRGKLLGVDHNVGQSWVGASVGLWRK